MVKFNQQLSTSGRLQCHFCWFVISPSLIHSVLELHRSYFCFICVGGFLFLSFWDFYYFDLFFPVLTIIYLHLPLLFLIAYPYDNAFDSCNSTAGAVKWLFSCRLSGWFHGECTSLYLWDILSYSPMHKHQVLNLHISNIFILV